MDPVPGGEACKGVEDAPGNDDVVVDRHVPRHAQHTVPQPPEHRGYLT